MDGAAYASRATYCAGKSTFDDAGKAMVVYGDPNASSGTPRVPNLAVGKVDVTVTPAAYPTTVTVRIVGFTINALFQSLTFSNKPAVTMMYLGNYQTGGC